MIVRDISLWNESSRARSPLGAVSMLDVCLMNYCRFSGRTTRRFEDHQKDVLSVAFSADNRQIVSGSRDKTIKLWNTLAQCKYTIVRAPPFSLMRCKDRAR